MSSPTGTWAPKFSPCCLSTADSRVRFLQYRTSPDPAVDSDAGWAARHPRWYPVRAPMPATRPRPAGALARRETIRQTLAQAAEWSVWDHFAATATDSAAIPPHAS
jgi:hypothetical protein